MLNLLLQAAGDIPSWQPVVVDLLTLLGGGSIVAFVVWLVRLLIPKIPRVLLPFLAMLLAWLGSYVASLIGGGDLNPIMAAALGAAAVWIREIKNTIEEHGGQS